MSTDCCDKAISHPLLVKAGDIEKLSLYEVLYWTWHSTRGVLCLLSPTTELYMRLMEGYDVAFQLVAGDGDDSSLSIESNIVHDNDKLNAWLYSTTRRDLEEKMHAGDDVPDIIKLMCRMYLQFQVACGHWVFGNICLATLDYKWAAEDKEDVLKKGKGESKDEVQRSSYELVAKQHELGLIVAYECVTVGAEIVKQFQAEAYDSYIEEANSLAEALSKSKDKNKFGTKVVDHKITPYRRYSVQTVSANDYVSMVDIDDDSAIFLE